MQLRKTPVLLVLVALGLSLSTFKSVAQTRLTASVVQNTYVGDFNPVSGSFYSPSAFEGQIGYNFGIEKNLDDYVTWILEFGFGDYESFYSIRSAIDPDVIVDNPDIVTYVAGKYRSATFGINWTFWETGLFDLFLGMGIGAFDFEIRDLDGRNLKNADVTRALNETVPRLTPIMPFSLGFILFSSSSFNIVYEASWIFSNTDYLDNIGVFGNPDSDSLFRNQIRVRYKLFNR